MSLAKSLDHLRPLGRNRDLRLLLGAGLVSQTGDWILATGIAFQIFALTGSTLATAAALLATQLPQVALGSVAGVLADRWDRRRVMIITNLALAVVLIPLVFVRDASQVWVIVAVVALSSCLSPFFVAAEVALLPEVVQPEHRISANAVGAQVRNVSRLIGAALGGVIISTGGLLWLALIDIATFAIAAALLIMIRHRTPRSTVVTSSGARDWVEGLVVIRRSRVLLVLLVVFVLSGLGEAVMGTLFAPFVAETLGGTANAFGAILSAQAVGGIVGGLVITAVGHRFSDRALFGWGGVAFGIGDLALFLYPLVPGLGQQVWPALVLIALVGLPGAALFAGMLTTFQTATTHGVRGRVWGALSTVQNLAMLIGTGLAGWAAQQLGILPVITSQGALQLLAGILVLVALTGVRARTTLEPEEDPYDDEEVLDNPASSTMLPAMPLDSNVRTATVTDPMAMRALAHPVRVELHGLVAREGTLTAADAARQLGISHALASHHLRQLAKYGFVEPAESPDQRAHPWRVTSTSLRLLPEEPEARASLDVLNRFTAERSVQRLAEWQGRRDDCDPAWADIDAVSESTLYLTRDELRTFMARWSDEVMQRALARPIGHAKDRPSDAVPVSFTLLTVPLPPTETGG